MSEEAITDHFTYSWKIKNFDMSTLNRGEYILSPWAMAESLNMTKWCLMLFPMNDNQDFPCYLHRSADDDGPNEITISGQIEIIDVYSGTKKVIHEFKNHTMRKGGYERTNILTDEDEVLENPCFLSSLNIHCLIKYAHLKNAIVTKCFATTEIITDSCAIQWNIRKFETFKDDNIFYVSLPLNMKLEVGFYLSEVEDEEKFAMIIIRKNEVKSVILKFTILLLDANGIATEFKIMDTVHSKKEVAATKRLISMKDLLEERDMYENEGILSLQCAMAVSDGKSESYIETLYSQAITNNQVYVRNANNSSLSEDFLQLYLESKFSDVLLKVDEESYPAHKSVLVARSPVFRAMFDQDMSESQEGIVDIVDVDSETLKLLLFYIYSGMLENLEYGALLKLYAAANKYMVVKLKEECAVLLKEKVCLENICEILASADLYEDINVKEQAENFILANSSKVLISDEWRDMVTHHPKLASEIMLLMSKHMVDNHKLF